MNNGLCNVCHMPANGQDYRMAYPEGNIVPLGGFTQKLCDPHVKILTVGGSKHNAPFPVLVITKDA